MKISYLKFERFEFFPDYFCFSHSLTPKKKKMKHKLQFFFSQTFSDRGDAFSVAACSSNNSIRVALSASLFFCVSVSGRRESIFEKDREREMITNLIILKATPRN